MTVVVMAAAIAYAFWTGRERARAYFGLQLFLTGAIVGVFAAQDLLLFYAPSVFLANLLRRGIEQPLIADSGRDLGDDTRDLGGIVARAQTGLLRTYALAIASSVAVLAIVFVAVK